MYEDSETYAFNMHNNIQTISLTHSRSLSLSIYKSAIADDLQFNFHSGSTHEVIFLLLYILLITVYFRDQTQCLKSLDFS